MRCGRLFHPRKVAQELSCEIAGDTFVFAGQEISWLGCLEPGYPVCRGHVDEPGEIG